MMFFKIKTAYPEYKPLFSFLLVRDFIAGSESHKQKKSSQDLHFSFFFKWFLMPKITNLQQIYAFFCRLNSLINRKKCLFTKLGFVIRCVTWETKEFISVATTTCWYTMYNLAPSTTNLRYISFKRVLYRAERKSREKKEQYKIFLTFCTLKNVSAVLHSR